MQSSVNHPLLTTAKGTRDSTEVNSQVNYRAEFLHERRKELYRMQNTKTEKQEDGDATGSVLIRCSPLPRGPRL